MEAALGKAGQPVNWGTMAHDHEMYMALADAAVELRDQPALKKYAPLLEELAKRDNHGFYLAIARRAQGVAQRLSGENRRAEASLKQAYEHFSQLGARWQAGRTLLEMAELELARSKKAKARQYMSEALSAFEELRAAPDVSRTHALLSAMEKN